MKQQTQTFIGIILVVLIICFVLYKMKITIPDTKQVVTVSSSLQYAKNLSYDIFELMERNDKKEITKKFMKKAADPLQQKLDSVSLILNQNDRDSLIAYRTRLLNDFVDRKAVRDSK